MAKKKWIQSAIKRPGRLRRMLGKKEGEPISQSELDQLAARARERGDRSLLAAVNLARRLKAMHRAQEGAVVGDPYVLIQLGYLEQGIGKPN